MSARAARMPPRGLYLITPDQADTHRLLQQVEAALASGIALLQYRNKAAGTALRAEQAAALRAACALHATPFIVNDDVELAQRVQADGVHLGEHDADPQLARRRLGAGAIVGVSCYDDLGRAERGAAAGADYLAFGAFHPSATKPGARRAAPALLQQAARFGLPRVAIGGITADNARPLLEAGADLLAVISDVFDAPDVAAAVRRYAPLFQDRTDDRQQP
jgi:thiamine-phosphate pyrophosphorylase